MLLFMFCLAIVVMGIILYNTEFGTQAIISSNGYLQSSCKPIFFSNNKSQRKKKHNMLRISKLRKK